MSRWMLTACMFAVAACEATSVVDVRIDAPDPEALNPFRPQAGVEQVRVVVRGPDPGDEVIVDRPPPVDSVRAEGLASSRVEVEVFGYDAIGSLRAYGRSPSVDVDGDVSVDVPFRRNLAYVIHAPDEDLSRPDEVVYVLDLISRTIVSRVELPSGTKARSICSWGGRAVLIGYRQGGGGGVGILSTDDHGFRPIELGFAPAVILAAPDRPVAVALDATRTEYVDLASSERLGAGQSIGGTPVDGVLSDDGRRGVVVMDLPPYVVEVDLRRRRERTSSVPQMVPSGVGYDRSRNQAYVVGQGGPVVAVDLLSGNPQPFSAGFSGPVGLATYAPHFDGVVAVQTEGSPVIRSFSTFAQGERGTPVPTVSNITGISSDGAGRRVVAVGTGSSTLTAGLTVLETRFDQAPQATSTLYPQDPMELDPRGRPVRYRPAGVAVPFGD
ncbi:MAG TPA: hypothetical protein RMG48_18380 [Myxococcales bacterium LLY-WYZ-16_1]|nr:hypothetical protein [Myxococcales bacterium LLY-WYZ-16_1]